VNAPDSCDTLSEFEQEILRQDAQFEAARHALSDTTETRFALPDDVWEAFQTVTTYMTRSASGGLRG
jgi:hypothetical protein